MLDTRSFEDSVQQKKSMVPIQQGESISDALELYNQNTVKRRKDLYRRRESSSCKIPCCFPRCSNAVSGNGAPGIEWCGDGIIIS